MFKKKKHELEDGSLDFPDKKDGADNVEIEKTTSIEGDRLEVNVANRKLDFKKVIVVVVLAFLVISSTFIVFYIKFGGENKEDPDFIPVDQAYHEQYVNDAQPVDLSKLKNDYALMGVDTKIKEEPQEEKVATSKKEAATTNDPGNIESQLNYQDSNADRYSDSIMQRKFGGSIMLETGNIVGKGGSESESNGYNNSSDPIARQNGRGDFLMGSSFVDGSVSGTINRDFLLSSGTNLACVLKTKVVTSYKGIVLCQLSKDVYSDNGKNLLIRAGALVEGTQTTEMMQGNARVFIVWDRVRDRDTIIRIDALGTDTLGASGVPAWVDNHFWKRFGNTIMLSFITDALSSAKTHFDRKVDADSVTLENFADNSSRMAEIALENSINIPPTAYINQGEKINILVPRNIDFSSIYKNVRY